MTSSGARRHDDASRSRSAGPRRHGCSTSRSPGPRTISSCRCTTRTANCAAGRLVAAVTVAEAATVWQCCADPQCPIAHPPSHQRPSIPSRCRPWRARRDRSHVGQVRRIWTPSGLAKALGDASRPDVRRRPGAGIVVRRRRRDDDADVDEASVAPGERFGAAVGRRQARHRRSRGQRSRATARSRGPTIAPAVAAAGSAPPRAARCTR